MLIKKRCQGGLFAGLMLVLLSGWAGEFRDVQAKAEKGDQAAMLEAGIQLVQGQEKPLRAGQALALLQPLAESGNARAMVWLGRVYREGLAGVEKSPVRAFQYFETAAGRTGRDPEGQLELGSAYLNGTGTDRNLIAAYMWTSLSLENGSVTPELADRAGKQQKQLAARLNDVQLEKARQLVSQIKFIYLN
ncbi:MAG: tetratricopeptide repeat protein [Endozoicomonas sp.]